MKEKVDVNSLTVGSFFAGRPRALPYWKRSQAKSIYKLYANLVFDIGYGRSKQILLFDKEPENDEEARFFKIAKWYLLSLEDKDSVSIGPDGPIRFYPDYQIKNEEHLVEACSIAVAFAWSNTDDPLIGSCLVDLALNVIGLGPTIHKRNESFDFRHAEDVALCKLTSSWITIDDACIDKVLRTDELIRELQDILSNFPIERAFLYGSYAQGTQLPGSDIDLAIVFDEGLTTREKGEVVEDLRKSIQKNIALLPDVKDLLVFDSDYLKSRFDIYLEVK